MASRMSMLLKDLDLTLNEFESDLAGDVPPVPPLPATSTLMNSLAKEGQAEDAADAYDFLDDYGDETEAVSEEPAAAPAAEPTPAPPVVAPIPAVVVPTAPKVTPTLTQFEPPVSMQHLMRQQNHHQQPATQPVPREYAAYQAPPAKFPSHIHVPHPNQQLPPQQQQLHPQQQYMNMQYQQQQHMQMAMPMNDDFRRISTATSLNSNGLDDTVSMTSRSAADDEVAALREQLERAKQDLQDQMYMNKVLVSQHTSKLPQQQQQSPISVSSPTTIPATGPSNESIKDKSDTVSVSSQKSSKSTSSGWFMSRSKSQSKDGKKPGSTATTPTTPVEMKKKKSTHKMMLAGA
ncbi:hypothetical protein HDU81_008350, partial [Chytriomyces hyalinus]